MSTDPVSSDPAPFDPNHPDLFVDRPKWPTVVGIISIAWAGVWLACGLMMAAFVVFLSSEAFAEMTEKGMGGPMPDAFRPDALMMVMGVVSSLWLLVLLFAGFATVKRAATGRGLHLLWAIVAVVLGIIGSYLQAKMLGEKRAWAEANPETGWAKNFKPGFEFVMALVTMFISFIYPVFLILWFGMGRGRERMK